MFDLALFSYSYATTDTDPPMARFASSRPSSPQPEISSEDQDHHADLTASSPSEFDPEDDPETFLRFRKRKGLADGSSHNLCADAMRVNMSDIWSVQIDTSSQSHADILTDISNETGD